MSDTLIQYRPLQAFTAQLFEAMGMSPADAAIEAEVLVWANLRGVDSHGVLRVPQYLRSVEMGGMNPKARYRIERETPATLLVEGDHAFGPVVTVFTMKKAIEKARQVGVGWAVIRNTSHQGAMAYYSLMAAREGMAGIAIVTNPPNMAPTGAKAAGVHNAPLSIAVPANEHGTICLDMATSVAARGKIDVAVDKGIPIPLGWALDRDGQPTTDPSAAWVLLPAGGYKGYGMALMFECLAGMMVGNPLLVPTLLNLYKLRPGTQNSIVAAVNISAFTDLDEYKASADLLVKGIKGLPRMDGVEEILLPGEIEDRMYAQRARDGVPLPQGTVDNLRAAAGKLGVEMPAELR